MRQLEVDEPVRRFKRYPTYRDPGIEWQGNAPAHWGSVRLTEHATVINGYPFDSEFFVRGDGIPLIRIRDLYAAETEVAYVGPIIEASWVEPGDVLVGMDGEFNVARWQGPRALLNQRMCCVRPKPSSEAKFLSYLLPFPLKVINDLTYSTTVKHLSSSDVRKIRYAAPPLEEQRAIATFLDRETGKIDALITKKERLLCLLQEERTAFITSAVTKGLDPGVPMRDSGVEWLGTIPAHWHVKKLKAVAHLQTGITLGKRYEAGQLIARPYLRVANVQDGFLDLHDIAEIELPRDEAQQYELRPGDVLLTEGGDFDKLGRGFVWEGQIAGCLHQNHIFAVRPIQEEIAPYFLAAVMSSGYGRAYFTATSVQSTNLASTNSTKLKSLPLSVPPRTEQEAIVCATANEAGKLDRMARGIRRAIGSLNELRTSLISAAVTGKIDVRKETA
jgi:type I restriction enzyme S subunit